MPEPTASLRIIPASLVLDVRQTWGVFAVAAKLPRPEETVVPTTSGRPRRERNDTWRYVYGLVVPSPLAEFNARALVQRALQTNTGALSVPLRGYALTWVEPNTLPPGILRGVAHLCRNKNPLSSAMRSARLVALMEHHGPICHWCQRFVQAGAVGDTQATIEHLVPRRDGGTDASHNLVVACYSCNQMRGSQEHSPLLF